MKAYAVVLLAAASALPAVAQEEGKIVAKGKPGSAAIFVDGKYLGPISRFTVAETYAVPVGDHEVTIRDPRYEPYTTRVTITPKKKTTVKFKLTPAKLPEGPFGTLRLGGDGPNSFLSVASGDTGAVYLNGQFYGHVDELNNKGSGILIAPGTYKLKIENSAYEMERDVTVEANKLTVVELTKN